MLKLVAVLAVCLVGSQALSPETNANGVVCNCKGLPGHVVGQMATLMAAGECSMNFAVLMNMYGLCECNKPEVEVIRKKCKGLLAAKKAAKVAKAAAKLAKRAAGRRGETCDEFSGDGCKAKESTFQRNERIALGADMGRRNKMPRKQEKKAKKAVKKAKKVVKKAVKKVKKVVKNVKRAAKNVANKIKDTMKNKRNNNRAKGKR